MAADEFTDIYVMDLGSDVRRNPKISGTTHNVFGIQTGVAIAFLITAKVTVGRVQHLLRSPAMMPRLPGKSWLILGTKPALDTITFREHHTGFEEQLAEPVQQQTLNRLIPLADQAIPRLARTSASEQRAVFGLLFHWVFQNAPR